MRRWAVNASQRPCTRMYDRDEEVSVTSIHRNGPESVASGPRYTAASPLVEELDRVVKQIEELARK